MNLLNNRIISLVGVFLLSLLPLVYAEGADETKIIQINTASRIVISIENDGSKYDEDWNKIENNEQLDSLISKSIKAAKGKELVLYLRCQRNVKWKHIASIREFAAKRGITKTNFANYVKKPN